MGAVVEAERRVPCLELLGSLEEADDLAVVVGLGRHPYQVVAARFGAAAVMSECTRSAIARSCSDIALIFSSRLRSPSSLLAFAFRSRKSSRIAAFSSTVNPWFAFADLFVACLLLAGMKDSPLVVLTM
ncbi:MAG TPA: hypothetical protein VGP82_14335 [Ktedonobacterales bacterium]|jgi:hypothetical protein|nr:hypothetical protein [Ktedonobacterales bacterium]